jgi:hypothetical protein
MEAEKKAGCNHPDHYIYHMYSNLYTPRFTPRHLDSRVYSLAYEYHATPV